MVIWEIILGGGRHFYWPVSASVYSVCSQPLPLIMRACLGFGSWWGSGEFVNRLLMANLLTFVVPLPFSVGGITVPFDVFAEFLPTSARLVCQGIASPVSFLLLIAVSLYS